MLWVRMFKKFLPCERHYCSSGMAGAPIIHLPCSSPRLNVNMLKMIQLGLTFSDHLGNLPRVNNELCVWQFNFR